jgi:hypothetical protein
MSSIIPASVLRQELRVARKSPDHYNKFARRLKLPAASCRESSKCEEVENHGFHLARVPRSTLRGTRSQYTFDNDVANSIRRGRAAGDDHPAHEPGVAA